MNTGQLKQFLLQLSPFNLIIFLILGVLLAMAWLFLCVRLDRTSPEPKRQILRIFLWGGFMVFPVLLITGPLTAAVTQIKWLSDAVKIFILSFMLDGLFEEWAKYSVLSEKKIGRAHV